MTLQYGETNIISDSQVEPDLYKPRECVFFTSPKEWLAHYGKCRFGLITHPKYIELLFSPIILFQFIFSGTSQYV